MYHRFNESKYSSTNIQMNIFDKHIKNIKSAGYDFLNPKMLSEIFFKEKLNSTKIIGVLLILFGVVTMSQV